MTRSRKKDMERLFVEEAAKHLGVTWHLGEDREHPDFLITEGGRRFGLEVTEIFAGTSNRAGSVMKKAESEKHNLIETARMEFEATHNVPLRLQIDGYICEENLAGLVSALVAIDFPSRPIGRAVVIDGLGSLRARAMRAFRPDWHSWGDRRGWVDRNPESKIAEAIKAKSRELPRYKSAAGADVRLLIVANRLQNSGKLTLQNGKAFDLHDFQAIYFYSRPEGVMSLGE